jgi:predicted nucleic acid-binding protein
MNSPVYFDTSVFLEISAKQSKHANAIREMLADFKREKIRVYTSILTIQETSVLSYRRSAVARDTYGAVANIARIWGMNKEVALTAAKLEAAIRDHFKESPGDSEMKHRRRWDCIHLATAQVLECSHFYTTDPHFTTRKNQLKLKGMKIAEPRPLSPQLSFAAASPLLVTPSEA